MNTIAVGSKFLPHISNVGDSAYFCVDKGGAMLVLFMNNLSQQEIEQLTTGPCRFGIVVLDGIIFLLYRFQCMNWSDAPYSWHLVSENRKPELNAQTKDTRVLLNIFVVDAKTGITKVIRLVSLSPYVSECLINAIKTQSTLSFNHNEHNSKINSIYAKYSSNHLAKMANTCTGGD